MIFSGLVGHANWAGAAAVLPVFCARAQGDAAARAINSEARRETRPVKAGREGMGCNLLEEYSGAQTTRGPRTGAPRGNFCSRGY